MYSKPIQVVWSVYKDDAAKRVQHINHKIALSYTVYIIYTAIGMAGNFDNNLFLVYLVRFVIHYDKTNPFIWLQSSVIYAACVLCLACIIQTFVSWYFISKYCMLRLLLRFYSVYSLVYVLFFKRTSNVASIWNILEQWKANAEDAWDVVYIRIKGLFTANIDIIFRCRC